MIKTCGRCKEKKDTSEFFKNKGRPDGIGGICKICHGMSTKAHYQKNREKYKGIVRSRRNSRRVIVLDYLKTHPCVDCGETDSDVLEFDHIDASSKLYDVSNLLNASLTTFWAEIEKCEVRCCNCHRRRTRRQQGWYPWFIPE